jgi:hypothetical protein
MLLFGASQGEPDDSDERRISLHRRIVLNPIAAKRLAIQLSKSIREYESRFGGLDGKVAVYERLKPTPPMTPPHLGSQKGAEKVDLLFKFLEAQKVKPAFERSCEFLAKRLMRNRFLLGFEKNMIRPNPMRK